MWFAVAVLLPFLAASVWPPPQLMHAVGPGLPLADDFRVVTNVTSQVLDSGVARFSDLFQKRLMSARAFTNFAGKSEEYPLHTLSVHVTDMDDTLGMMTKYDYKLEVTTTTAVATATSIYGALYALETFTQLVEPSAGGLQLSHSSVSIIDSPDYDWRGLMIDAGRRFFPLPLVKNLLDTMAANKLNVLHLHASDMCRFGVQSKIFPNLTASLTGIHAGFYSQDDVADMIKYASARGIRVVPEFDVPGHSRGFIPLEGQGVVFCDPASASRSQIYGDPAGSTHGVLTKLFKEMSSLFPDEVFHLGCDETSVTGVCDTGSTFALEGFLYDEVEKSLGKTPSGWEEAHFNAGAGSENAIVNVWTRHTAKDVVKQGRKAVESRSAAFYFTRPAAEGADGWKSCWYDIATGVSSADLPLVLGGEMSMWSDTYCYTAQCGASSGTTPVGAALFDPKHDAEFGRSIGGMIWPRGYVGAAAFWNFNTTTDPTSATFVDAIWKLNDDLQARGSLVCPSKCACDQLTACGKPYLEPSPVKVGDSLALAPCLESMSTYQQFQQSAGALVLRSNSSLCVHSTGSGVYPTVVALCSVSSDEWTHLENGQIRTSDAACLDVRDADGTVGVWSVCGEGQANQMFEVDPTTGNIVSLAPNYGGYCVTVHE